MTPTRPTSPPSPVAVGLALFALYAVWGSTYLAMRVALEGFPPFLMAAVRFVIAGTVMLGIARARGLALPTPRQWRNALAVGGLLLAGGNGFVAIAEQTVGSGLAALMVSAMPLWMALFAGLWGHWPGRREWLGLGLGLLGIVVLNVGSELRGTPVGVAALLFATASWAFGSLWSRRLDLPEGLMAAGAEMLAGGAVLVVLTLVTGERLPSAPGLRPVLAVAYLVVFGSLVAYSAYLWLLANVRPALASSYAYVNPVVALVIGAALGGERLPPALAFALPLVLVAVVLVLRPAAPAPVAPVLGAGPGAPGVPGSANAPVPAGLPAPLSERQA